MNWDAIGAVGQVLGSIAVFITLVYLSVQIRHARDEVQRSISHHRKDALRQLFISRANNKWLTEVVVKAAEGFGVPLTSTFQKALVERAGLTRAEATALGQDFIAYWECQAEAIPYVHYFRDGERAAFDIALRMFFQSPMGDLWYKSAKPRLDPDAVRYVDDLLARSS